MKTYLLFQCCLTENGTNKSTEQNKKGTPIMLKQEENKIYPTMINTIPYKNDIC